MSGEWFIEMLFGDRVRTEPNERVDQVDFDALQHLVYSYVSEAFGALVGEGSGCLTTPTLSYSNNGTNWFIHIGPFQLYYSFRSRRSTGDYIDDANDKDAGGTNKIKAIRGAILTHDPTESGQVSTLDVTAWVAAAQAIWNFTTQVFTTTPPLAVMPFLWARPVLVDDDDDARRKWDVGSSAEVPVTIKTRRRVRVEFRVAATQPAVPTTAGVPDEPTWIKIGRFSSWALDTDYDATNRLGPEQPVLWPKSVWDGDDWFEFTREPGTSTFDGNSGNTGGADGTLQQYGLPPESFVSDGQILPSNSTPSTKWGFDLFKTHTSGVSALLAPNPPWVPEQGWVNEGSTSGSQGRKKQPVGLGLVGLTHLMRNRLKTHLEGGLTKISDGSKEDWAGSTLDNEHRGKFPWWDVPKYGLAKIASLLDQITGVDLPALQAALTAETSARVSGDANIDVGPRLLFAVHAKLDTGSGSSYVFDVYHKDGNADDIPTIDATGKHLWRVASNLVSYKPGHMVVFPCVNNDGSWGSTFDAATYDAARAGISVRGGETVSTSHNPLTFAAPWYIATVSMRGQDSSGTWIPVYCSYTLLVFEDVR